MSKELEALKIIKIKCHPNSNPSPLVDEALNIIEQALQKLDKYEDVLKEDRLTGQEENGKYYTVEEKILIANEPVNPTRTWIVHNENRRYGSPMDKLGKLEDIYEEEHTDCFI